MPAGFGLLAFLFVKLGLVLNNFLAQITYWNNQ
jgi:hypothetical protein